MNKFLKAASLSALLATGTVVSPSVSASFLVFDSGRSETLTVLGNLGLTAGTDYDVAAGAAFSALSVATLQSYDFIFTGWALSTTAAGHLAASNLDAAVNGRVVITGQDPDFHGTFNTGAIKSNAQQALSNMFTWVAGGSGTGLVALSDYINGFSWTSMVDVGSVEEHANDVQISLAHEIFTGLTSAELSGWGNSRHNYFTGVATGFMAVATDSTGSKIITIVSVPEPGTVMMLAVGLFLLGFGCSRRSTA